MNRNLAAAAVLAIPAMAVVFWLLGQWLPGLSGYAAGLVVYWLALTAVLVAHRGEWSLRLRWPWPLHVALLVIAVASLAVTGTGALLSLSPGMIALCALAAAINAPLEEAFWRGALVPRVTLRTGWGQATLAVLLFGAAHLALLAAPDIAMPGGSVAMVAGATLLGWLFMAARISSGTAGAGAVAHGIINLFAFSALVAANPVAA